MAHFAELDTNNIVLRVLSVDNGILVDENDNESEQKGIEFLKSLFGSETNWVQTSYNGKFRNKYAGIGFQYNPTLDVFILPKPHDSWVLDSNYDWHPPVPYPTDGKNYVWNETNINWDPE